MKKCFFLALSLFIATLVSAQMSGTYTINSNSSTNPDYTSFSAAASALSAGVTGQVIFEVAPGTYEEYVTINQINGASATNRVIFRGMGTSNQQVVITSNAGYTDNATVKLNGTDYITFENMTVTTTSTGSNAQTLRFNGQCDYTRFENVRFVGVDVSSPSSNDNGKNLVHMYNGDDIVDHDTQFVGCQFINGSIALYLQGKNMNLFNENVLVEGCHFENQSFKSIHITFHNNVVLRGNTIVNANDYKNDYNAIDIFQCYQGGLIENNVINVTRASAYTTVFKIRPLVGTADNHVIIRNNIIDLNCNSNSYSYAFSIDYNDSNYIDFAHNTIKCSGTGQNGNIYIQKNGQNFNLYNNLLVNESTGYVFRFLTTVDSRICDYNRIAFSGNNIGRIGTTDYATLSDWTTGTGFDAHSALCTPNFVSANDLHLASAEGLTVANPLSYVTKDIDDQDRSTTEPCAGADEFSSVIPVTVGTATFDDLTLNANGIWEGEEEENYMLSGGWYFTNYNYPEWSFWTGFTASNRTDLTPTGLSAQFTAAAGEGLNGSDQYGVAYVMGYGYLTDVFSADGQEHAVTGCYVTNNLWAYQNMLDGDATATPFGGATGNDPDWFKLTAIGKNLEDEVVGTAEFYLADYRFENNDEDYILNTWEWFDLSSLGEVFTISFELSSTKNNTYGMVTPAYFCIEDFNGEAPLPPTPQDQPPYVANQIEPINFTEYPQSFTFDITEAFDDPDNNNLFIEIEVYSCPEEITATIDADEEYLTVSRNTASAFTDKTLVLRATSNGLYVDMNISVSGEEVVINVGTATFDDVTLNASGIWTGADENNLMVSGGWFFTNTYWPEYYAWGGFTASNHTDMTQSGLSAQYTAATGAGYDGSDQYGVAYVMGYGVPTDVYAADGQEHTVTGFYVTNNLWAYQNMLDGDATATPFGGTTGNDPDWFKLTAIGKNAAGQTVGTAEFYLADYRFENNDEDYILNTWEWFDLSSLGAVHTISFELSSTKNNAYGMVTPAYFCLENFNGEAPLPPTPDEPPYIANPVEDVVFNEYPQSIQINLNGVASDPDDPDEDITYSIVSNSNTTALTATITNKILVLVRNNDQQAEADVVIRATSDGQTVDFTVHVIINEVVIPDEPPYVVNPVEDVVFNEYPETINVNLDGVVTDDDDPDEDIVYSIVSNSNTTALTATITNKILVLVRNNDQQAEADVVIRATSDGQTVDFTVHVIINEVVIPDEPPYVVNPVEDVVFNEYPETINVNLDGVVTDDDDPDEDIVYSIVSNSNEEDLTATLNGKVLTLTRNHREAATATIMIRATSDEQYVDFEINVIINLVPNGVAENGFNMSVYPNPTHGEVYITIENAQQFNYFIYDMVGQNVMSGVCNDSEARLDLSDLEKGVYFISASWEGNRIVKKIIVR